MTVIIDMAIAPQARIWPLTATEEFAVLVISLIKRKEHFTAGTLSNVCRNLG